MTPVDRNKVLVIGDAPLDATPFTQRGLVLHRTSITEAHRFFSDSRAVLVVDFPHKFGLIKQSYLDLFPVAADHELLQIVLVHTTKDSVQVAAISKAYASEAPARILTVEETWRAAEECARHVTRPSAGTLIIQPASVELSEDERLLLRRSFSDCERIFIEPLIGGMASACVLRVHAWVKRSVVGPCPLPFFVKIGTSQSISEERQKYELYADHYIPFTLRPNIIRNRCVRTRKFAALVGNFVDDAVPLRQSLRLGHGIGALFSLFEKTLRGFRVQPFVADAKPMDNVLEGFVRNRSRARKISDQVLNRAREFDGTVTDPIQCESTLYALAKPLACLFGPCHGDLHAGNVMVRGGDAIVIDVSEASAGPLTADPAALEVSLLFGTDDRDNPNGFSQWREFIDEIYAEGKVTLHPAGLFEAEPGAFSWLRRSLRELRHVLLGCDSHPFEAPLVLAAYLLRYARLGIERLDNEELRALALDRHAYALVVAQRIVRSISAKGS